MASAILKLPIKDANPPAGHISQECLAAFLLTDFKINLIPEILTQ